MKHLIKSTFIASFLAIFAWSSIPAGAENGEGSPLEMQAPAARVSASPRSVQNEYKRLLALRARLGSISIRRQDREPYKSFIKRNQKDIVYSEPAGQWFVRSDRFWDLYLRAGSSRIADDIAWTAANNPLPGECEGFVNCYVQKLNITQGRYLKAFRRGRHGNAALSKIAKWIGEMVVESGTKKNLTAPAEPSEKAELQKLLTDLLKILAKVPGAGKAKPIALTKKLADMYK